jgi:hypothetical protein
MDEEILKWEKLLAGWQALLLRYALDKQRLEKMMPFFRKLKMKEDWKLCLGLHVNTVLSIRYCLRQIAEVRSWQRIVRKRW